jgi:hypothetical protein
VAFGIEQEDGVVADAVDENLETFLAPAPRRIRL